MNDYGPLNLKPEFIKEDGTPVATQANTGSRYELRLIDAKSGHNRHAVNTEPTMLRKLFSLGVLGGDQARLDAGERLQEDWEATGNRPKAGASYSPFRGSAGSEETPEERLAAVRYNAAVKSIQGYDRHVVIKVCMWNEMCDGLDLQRLCRGLDQLSKHYGLR